MDPVVIAAVLGFLGLCVGAISASIAPIISARSAAAASVRAETRAEAAEKAANDARVAASLVVAKVEEFKPMLDGNLSKMVDLAERAAAALARADEKQLNADTAAQLAETTKVELEAAKAAPRIGEIPNGTTEPKTIESPGG